MALIEIVGPSKLLIKVNKPIIARLVRFGAQHAKRSFNGQGDVMPKSEVVFKKRTAILVVHGIGQQQSFETLDSLTILLAGTFRNRRDKPTLEEFGEQVADTFRL